MFVRRRGDRLDALPRAQSPPNSIRQPDCSAANRPRSYSTPTAGGMRDDKHASRGRTMPRQRAPSGQQFEISHGQHRATVVEVGGGLRRYRDGERELLDGYVRDERCTGARGLPLVPWPDRIEDGTYTFDGVDYQVPLTEPDKHNAIHGLLRWRNWTCRLHSRSQVVMGLVLHPQMGYRFSIDVSVDHSSTTAA